MDLETFITAVFCLADDFVRDLTRAGRLRRRGPEPALADSEVLTIEAVGEFLGLDTDQALHDRAVAPQLLDGLKGWALGDGGYWSPVLRAELAADGLDLIAPPRGTEASVVVGLRHVAALKHPPSGRRRSSPRSTAARTAMLPRVARE